MRLSLIIRILVRGAQRSPVPVVLLLFALITAQLAGSLLVGYATQQWSYDTYHPAYGTLFRVNSNWSLTDRTIRNTRIECSLVPLLANEVADIEDSARFFALLAPPLIRVGERVYEGTEAAFVDPSFFDLFTIPIWTGTRPSSPQDLVLTKETARRFFGSVDVIGKPLTLNGVSFKVSGVLENLPRRTHLRIGLLMPTSAVRRVDGEVDLDSRRSVCTAYVRTRVLNPAATASAIRKTAARHGLLPKGGDLAFELEPVAAIHNNELKSAGPGHGNSNLYVRLLFYAGCVILTVVLINLGGVVVVWTQRRSLEIDIRRLHGASTLELVSHFVLAVALLLIVSFGVAILLGTALGFAIDVGLDPQFRVTFLDVRPLVYQLASTLGLAAIITAWTVRANLRDTLSIASVRVSSHLSSHFRFNSGEGLLVFQMTLVGLALASTIVVGAQVRYMLSGNLGFDPSGILVCDTFRLTDAERTLFSERLRQLPGIQLVSASSATPTQGRAGSIVVGNPDTGVATLDGIRNIRVTADFFRTYAIGYLHGDPVSFSSGFGTEKVVLTIRAANLSLDGIESDDISDLIGSRVNYALRDYEVAGVVNDFFLLSQEPGSRLPLALFLADSGTRYVSVRLQPDVDVKSTRDDIERLLARLFPEKPIEIDVLDDQLRDVFHAELVLSRAFRLVSVLGFLVFVLGLMSAVLTTAERRTLELGVRRAFGASEAQLYWTIGKRYSMIAVLGLLIGSPLGLLMWTRWQEHFAFRSHLPLATLIGGEMLVLVLCAVVVTTALAIMFQKKTSSILNRM